MNPTKKKQRPRQSWVTHKGRIFKGLRKPLFKLKSKLKTL